MRGKTWERADAIRELVRGRMEVCGPITVGELTDTLVLQRSEIDAALLALEAEGFILRGKFHPKATEQEWCDRRLLARIHRLTIDRLRAEIQPVSVHDFYRFLFAWQRADVNIALKVRKVCNRFWNNSMGASCHWPRGNRRSSPRALPTTIPNGSIAFVFPVASAGDV